MSSSSTSSCLPTPTSPALVISSPTQLALPTPSTWVSRNGTRLYLDGEEFKMVGANVYWLGLDENVAPYPTYPSRDRVLEMMATVSAMGGTAIRSTSLGVSVGYAKSLEPTLGVFNEEAFEAIDWAIFAAKSYGLRLILPLTDQYNYYHGGIPTFLTWNNLSSTSSHTPFYNLSSPLYTQFITYLTTLISHRSNLTGLTMGEEPTVMVFETGNELGGYGGKGGRPPVEWTESVAKVLKGLAPNALVMSGTYGVVEEELGIDEVDIYSNHYYPLYSYNLQKSASLASSHNKAFFVGEYDWTDRWYRPIFYLAVLIPVLIAASLWLMPGRWWPWRIGCGCCEGRRGKKGRRKEKEKGSYVGVGEDKESSSLTLGSVGGGQTNDTFPPAPPPSTHQLLSPLSPERPNRRFRFPSEILIRRYHLAIFLVLLAPVLAGIIHVFLPTPLKSFLGSIESLSKDGKVVGDMYWSLFGRDDTCCSYVQHNDGYTLHYPLTSTSLSSSIQSHLITLTQHAFTLRGLLTPSWNTALATSAIGTTNLPVMGCPQTPLTIPGNATWSGGNGTIGFGLDGVY